VAFAQVHCRSGDRARRFAPLQINTREDEAGDFYEEELLIQADKSGIGGGAATAETIQEVLLQDIHRFVGEAESSENITLVVLNREPGA